ncbi:MAG: orotidine-5'-phosphate decarboxylase [Thermoguttaceae bacterium]
MTFSQKLQSAIYAKKNPVLVGLDPRIASLPKMFGKIDGNDVDSVANAFETFCKEVVDVVAPLVPAVKPQVAFFEQYGPTGLVALQNVVRYAREKGLLVILDGKRNDIGTTATAYADGWIGGGKTGERKIGSDEPLSQSVWGGDALTISPYLGDDSLTPFVEVAVQRNGGVFILVKTSNPGGAMFQDLIANGRPLYRHVGDYVQSLALKTSGEGKNATRYGAVGAVVGATWPEQLRELRESMPNVWFLIPGFGVQGGSAKDVGGAFDADGLGGIVNNSRGIIFAYDREPFRSRFSSQNWQNAVEAATIEMIGQLRAETSVGQLG